MQQTNVEIIVTEGDEEGPRIASMVQEIGASVLVVGLHDRSFLYKLPYVSMTVEKPKALVLGSLLADIRLALVHNNIANSFNCRVLAIKQPAASPQVRARMSAAPAILDGSTNMDFAEIEINRFIPAIPSPKVPYRICPSPYAIIWRCRKPRRKKTAGK